MQEKLEEEEVTGKRIQSNQGTVVWIYSSVRAGRRTSSKEGSGEGEGRRGNKEKQKNWKKRPLSHSLGSLVRARTPTNPAFQLFPTTDRLGFVAVCLELLKRFIARVRIFSMMDHTPPIILGRIRRMREQRYSMRGEIRTCNDDNAIASLRSP